MSKQVEVEVTCPKCRVQFETTLYRSLWIEYPENRNLIFNDEINLVTCPSCSLDGLTLTWPVENGKLKKINVDGTAVDDREYPEPTTTVSTGWQGQVADRVFEPHEALVVELEFENQVLWTY